MHQINSGQMVYLGGSGGGVAAVDVGVAKLAVLWIPMAS